MNPELADDAVTSCALSVGTSCASSTRRSPSMLHWKTVGTTRVGALLHLTVTQTVSMHACCTYMEVAAWIARYITDHDICAYRFGPQRLSTLASYALRQGLLGFLRSIQVSAA